MNHGVQAEMHGTVHVDGRASDSRSALSLADRLTISRMAAAPLLIIAAASGAPRFFCGLVVFGLLTDVLDGVVARRLHQSTARGARMDSRADLVFYFATLVGVVLLVPDRVAVESTNLFVVLAAYLLPIAAGWIKFRRLTSYHTVMARVALILMLTTVGVWLVFHAIVPVRIATAVLILSGMEELLITILLRVPRENVVHVGRVWRERSSSTSRES